MMFLNALQHTIGIFAACCQPLKFFRIVNTNKYFCFFSTSDFIGCQPKQFHKTQQWHDLNLLILNQRVKSEERIIFCINPTLPNLVNKEVGKSRVCGTADKISCLVRSEHFPTTKNPDTASTLAVCCILIYALGEYVKQHACFVMRNHFFTKHFSKFCFKLLLGKLLCLAVFILLKYLIIQQIHKIRNQG